MTKHDHQGLPVLFLLRDGGTVVMILRDIAYTTAMLLAAKVDIEAEADATWAECWRGLKERLPGFCLRKVETHSRPPKLRKWRLWRSWRWTSSPGDPKVTWKLEYRLDL